MTRNLFQIIALNTLLLFGVNSCVPQETNSNSQYEHNVQIFGYSPTPKKATEQRPTIFIKNSDKPKIQNSNLVKKTNEYLSLTEEVMTEDILSNSPNEVSFDSIGYAGVGISVNAMVKSFLPNLNKPMFEFNSPLNLPLNPNLTKCDAPIETYSENQNPKVGIYLRFKL